MDVHPPKHEYLWVLNGIDPLPCAKTISSWLLEWETSSNQCSARVRRPCPSDQRRNSSQRRKNGPQQKSSHCEGLRNGVIQPSVLRCPKDCGSWVYVFKTHSVGRMDIHTDSKSEYAVRFLFSACTRLHWRTKNAEDPDPHIFGHTNSMVPEEKHLHLLSMAKLRCLASVKRRWTLFSQGRVWLYDLAWNGKFFIVLCW